MPPMPDFNNSYLPTPAYINNNSQQSGYHLHPYSHPLSVSIHSNPTPHPQPHPQPQPPHTNMNMNVNNNNSLSNSESNSNSNSNHPTCDQPCVSLHPCSLSANNDLHIHTHGISSNDPCSNSYPSPNPLSRPFFITNQGFSDTQINNLNITTHNDDNNITYNPNMTPNPNSFNSQFAFNEANMEHNEIPNFLI